MFKKIRDYVYDISDVFLTLLIIIAAAGIIIWRASSLVDYPKYIDAHPSLKASIETALREQDEKRIETAERRAKEAGRQVVKTSLTIESDFDGDWGTVADRLITARIIKATDREEFVSKASDLYPDDKPDVGTYALSSDMTFSQIVRILCSR